MVICGYWELSAEKKEQRGVVLVCSNGVASPRLHGISHDRMRMSYLVPIIAVVFVMVVAIYLASVPQEEDQQFLIVILGLIVPLIILAIGVEAFWKE
ncbi:hypothetical protein Tco_1448503 [Tanacetum coccineum]